MNRAELVEAIANETKQTKAACDKWLATFINVVENNIDTKDGVKLVGFGTVDTVDRAARTGRNPQTGEEIKIPARKVPVFKPGTELKAIVLNK